jgi:hypothetical protein
LAFPLLVFFRQAFGTRAIPRTEGVFLVCEEYPMLHILTFGDEPQSRLAVKPTVDFQLAMSAKRALYSGLVWFAVEADQGVLPLPTFIPIENPVFVAVVTVG